MKHTEITNEYLITLYTKNHLTLREISKIVGISHVAISKRLKQAGITSQAGEQVNVICFQCQQPFRVNRARHRKRLKLFCSIECYNDKLASNYKPWRNGQKIARTIVKQHFPLQTGHIVHHIDNDNHNNHISNLMVFASQSDHLKHHRGITVIPLFNGSQIK